MNAYEQKQADRKERYQELAERKRAQSDATWQEADRMAEIIPFGQPILVGHHSEKGHRSLLNRIDNKRHKACELGETADYYERRAENINNNISSDDPDAIEKLKAKLARLEADQISMKTKNAEARKNKTAQAFQGFYLTNNNANIRTVKQRIEQLEKARDIVANEDIKGNGWTLHENKEENRIQFLFEAIPGEEIRKMLKSRGFRWSPTNKAWQRQLNNAGRYYAKYIISNI